MSSVTYPRVVFGKYQNPITNFYLPPTGLHYASKLYVLFPLIFPKTLLLLWWVQPSTPFLRDASCRLYLSSRERTAAHLQIDVDPVVIDRRVVGVLPPQLAQQPQFEPFAFERLDADHLHLHGVAPRQCRTAADQGKARHPHQGPTTVDHAGLRLRRWRRVESSRVGVLVRQAAVMRHPVRCAPGWQAKPTADALAPHIAPDGARPRQIAATSAIRLLPDRRALGRCCSLLDFGDLLLRGLLDFGWQRCRGHAPRFARGA